LREVLSSTTVGNQAKKAGLGIRASFAFKNNSLTLELEVTNASGVQVNDFDIMFNKNPFGIAVFNASSVFSYP
jgi:hypothetical protein